MIKRNRIKKTIVLLMMTPILGCNKTVKTESMHTLSAGANLNIPSIPNLRDLGGYDTADGKKIKTGLLYRSNQLNPISTEDESKIDALHLKTVYDLRTAAERSESPDQIPGSVKEVWLDVLADASTVGAATLGKTLQNPVEVNKALGNGKAVELFKQIYLDLIVLPSAKKAYHDFFLSLANGKNLPALFHCTAGKDRTGWAAASLLSLLGTPKDQIYSNYLDSNTYLVPAYKKEIEDFVSAGGEENIILDVLGVKKEYLDAAFTAVQNNYGSIENYFEKGLNIDRATQEKIKKNLLSQ
ncbi:tyrosine-protein phosphatase [Chryseobacterium sp. MEBOG06]|uniref:tyrosine-protein phosphatase n=1 Tax=Chryseobacterium sp. MEBOG06 TaxID=2879938 RepID=UPI001F36A8B0|nr:tyrosine-protein phosphatase [Chryseobacterium sp. MEBOG06]UKB83538.1 tyrosine-protein phosphatase [Chryseobacterium sp. MEBOG06]